MSFKWRVSIKPSTRLAKKLMAVFENGSTRKTVHFGARGASDYTIHRDNIRKERYHVRHYKNENWDDPFTAGALSRWILWNKPTLRGSIQDFKRRFNFK
jgi:hypothetical protein